MADALKEFTSARPGPVLPAFNVSMMNRIVMYVIQRHPKVSLGFHRAFEAVVPALSSSSAVISIPLKGRAPMELAQGSTQILDVFGHNQDMIVIREHTPRVDVGAEFTTTL